MISVPCVDAKARVWSFFRKYDTTMDQYTDFIKGDPSKEPMPLYVKPNRKLSVQDVQNGRGRRAGIYE